MEHGNGFLAQMTIYFASAVFAVMAAHRLGLGSVAGYLLAGIAIGPWGLRLVEQPEAIHTFAELGVVFLLFVIGLELEPHRLWTMRARLIGLGLSQVVGSIVLIAGVAYAFGIDMRVAIVGGMALSLSSTALALQPLTERGGLSTQGGQATFAILLFQDLAVIPMLAVLPLLGTSGGWSGFSFQGVGFAAAVVIGTLVLGHFLARPVFRHIARTRLREIFTAFALLLVLGIALLFEKAGLSMALGAFLAGVLLAESEYRHEIEAAIDPFKGMLLGLFFISVGMSADFTVMLERPWVVVAFIVGLLLLKGAVLWFIAARTRMAMSERPLFILLLAQGGEFAFVILGLASGNGAIPEATAQAVTLAVALSMLLTPFLLVLHDRVIAPRFRDAAADAAARAADAPQPSKVVIAGLGRVGQVVARLLNASGYQPTVLDDDPDHVEQSREYGFRVFYGDATRLDLLHAAGADTADLLVITLDDRDAITRLARVARQNFPRLRIISRARDMRHMFELRDLGVEMLERETWLSALKLGETALAVVTQDPERARRATRSFEEHDHVVQAKLYAAHKSQPGTHVTISNELRDQFKRTLAEDQEEVRSRLAP
ncbi:MAG TPA: monovalent cation:proton antiporter-2 (CPA2) family protein [Burkholderiales bacterium]|nr:monovalent cation:proton antiporter-2 (CPA2) family protein [Burkholderiales bacterium]